MAMSTADYNTPKAPKDLNEALLAGHENGQKLLSIIERARRLSDFIDGAHPRPTQDGRDLMGGGGLIDRLTTHFNAESEALSDLSSELSRVERALGLEALNVAGSANAMSAGQMRGRF